MHPGSWRSPGYVVPPAESQPPAPNRTPTVVHTTKIPRCCNKAQTEAPGTLAMHQTAQLYIKMQGTPYLQFQQLPIRDTGVSPPERCYAKGWAACSAAPPSEANRMVIQFPARAHAHGFDALLQH